MMKTRLAIVFAAVLLAACVSRSPERASPPTDISHAAAAVEQPAPQTSAALSINDYKRELAMHISRLNTGSVFSGRPQALLRSVVVLRYTIDADGALLRSKVLRSNHDRQTEATALTTLRNSAPFPRPAPYLLHRGRLDISETWLFNNDGRFQLRSIAESQMDH